jgi:hypothetical protein
MVDTMKVKIRVKRGKGAVAAVSETISAPPPATLSTSIDSGFTEGF